MEQFEIKRLIPIDLFGFDASFTNASLFMVIAVALIAGFLIFAMGRRQLVPGRLQSMAELSYEYIANMVRENLGEEGMKYFPWVFTIFMFILTLNLLGMIPHSFTVTSHIIVTFAFAAMVWIVVTIIGFWRHGAGYPAPVRARRRAMVAVADHRADRAHLLFHPPDQPLGASVRQHDGRAHDAEGVRRLRRRTRRARRLGAVRVRGRPSPASRSWWPSCRRSSSRC